MRTNRLPAPGTRLPDTREVLGTVRLRPDTTEDERGRSPMTPVGSGSSRIETEPGARRRAGVALALLLIGAVGSAACRQDMHQAPRYDPLESSDFFADGRASRPLVEGTVARGNLREDKVFYTGRVGTQLVSEIPVKVTRELLVRGQQRYDIYCSPCHSRVGDGNGMVVQRGFKRPPSFHDQRLRDMPIGHFYDVMTNGFGAMQDYSAQVQPQDRWAIAAYVRALQFSRNAPAALLSEQDRRAVETGKGPDDAGAAGQAGERSGIPHKGGGTPHE